MKKNLNIRYIPLLIAMMSVTAHAGVGSDDEGLPPLFGAELECALSAIEQVSDSSVESPSSIIRAKRQRSRILSENIKNTHEKISYACDRCTKVFSRKDNLNRHIVSVHKGKRYQCPLCEKNFAYKSNLQEHITEHSFEYICQICEKIYKSKKNLKEHMQTVHEEKRYQCDFCEKSFTHRYNVLKHRQSVHEKVRHTCPSCNDVFTSKNYLKEHIQSMHEGIKYQCSHCEKTFNFKTHLRLHIRTNHATDTASTKRRRSSGVHEDRNDTGLLLSAEEIAAFFNVDQE